MLKNSQTCFENLAVFTDMFEHFSTLCMKGLKTKYAKQIQKSTKIFMHIAVAVLISARQVDVLGG